MPPKPLKGNLKGIMKGNGGVVEQHTTFVC